MVIRNLRSSDDLGRAAEILFLADPYIMEALFGNKETAGKVGRALFSSAADDLFSFDRVLVAEEDGEIQGILCFRNGCCNWDQKILGKVFQDINLAVPTGFNRVNEVYLNKLSCDELPPNSSECMFLAVSEDCRGKGIGSALLKHWMDTSNQRNFYLDVLADNHRAIAIYQKHGFVVTEQHKGFSRDETARPECYRMVKERSLNN